MTQDHAGVKFPPPLIYCLGMIGGYVLNRLQPLPILSPDRDLIRRVLGWLGVACFFGLAFTALGLFKRVGTTFHPRRPSTTLVESGPYRFTRNPMYVSFACLMIGVAFLSNSIWTLALTAVVVLIMDRTVIQREERYLERKFGNEYLRYKSRVRRWL